MTSGRSGSGLSAVETLIADSWPLSTEGGIHLDTAQNALVLDGFRQHALCVPQSPNLLTPANVTISYPDTPPWPTMMYGRPYLRTLIAKMLGEALIPAKPIDPDSLYLLAGVTATIDTTFRILTTFVRRGLPGMGC